MSRRGLREVLARARRDPAAYAGEGVGEAGAVAGHVEQVRVLDGALGGHATHPRDLRLVQVVHDRHVDRVGCAADRCAPAVLRLLEGDAARVERVLLDLVDADQREQLWRELRRTIAQPPAALRAVRAPLVLEDLVEQLALALRDVDEEPREREGGGGEDVLLEVGGDLGVAHHLDLRHHRLEEL